jgi:NitT/TauT family transport system permease protein
VVLGLLIGSSKRLAAIVDPVLQLIRQTSAFALFPVFILFLGIGEALEGRDHLLGVVLAGAAEHHQRREAGRPVADQLGAVDGRVATLHLLQGGTARRRCHRFSPACGWPGAYSITALVAAEMIGAHSGWAFSRSIRRRPSRSRPCTPAS